MQLDHWPKPVSHAQFTSPKAGGGKRLACLMRKYKFVVDSNQTLECKGPRGRSGMWIFYAVNGYDGLWVGYTTGDTARLRFVYRRGNRFMTYSPDAVGLLVVIVDGREVDLYDHFDAQAKLTAAASDGAGAPVGDHSVLSLIRPQAGSDPKPEPPEFQRQDVPEAAASGYRD